MEKPKILLIIPAYNEEESILRVCREIEAVRPDIDYVVINDGSTDNTKQVLEENNLNHINLVTNLGIGGAVQTGYKYALENGYDIAIQYDGDGQHDVNYAANICEPLINGEADFCIGSRYLDKTTSGFQSTPMRRFGKNIISSIINTFWKFKVTDPTSGFRAANKKIIEKFASDYPSDYPEPETLVSVLKDNFKVTEVPVNMRERETGTSFVSIGSSSFYMIKVSLAIILDSIFKQK